MKTLTGCLLFAVAVMAQGCAKDDFWSREDGGSSSGNDSGSITGECNPGNGKCVGNRTYTCRQDGKGYTAGQACKWPTVCNYGKCMDPCVMSKVSGSYVGCEYFAIDMGNAPSVPPYYSAQNGEYALVVTNATDSEKSVNVKIYSKAGGKETVIAQGKVPSNYATVFKIAPPLNVYGTSKTMQALRLVSDGPVTVYQFNPLNNTEKAYSNDASLLLPVPSLNRDYIVTTGDGSKIRDTYNKTKIYNAGAMVAVVATADNTKVTVVPTQDIQPAAGITAGGKAPVTVVLNRYEVLNLESRTPDVGFGYTPKSGQANLSGTVVHSDKPVAVFAGNICASVPFEVVGSGLQKKLKCCCDHLEEQFFPLSSWGKTFVATVTKSRNKNGPENNHWRVTGGANGVKLTYLPKAPSGAPSMLNKGQSVQFKASSDFVLQASGPVMLTQFIASSGDVAESNGQPCSKHADCNNLPFVASCHPIKKTCYVVGDPAMILVPPAEQFRTKYVFLTPKDYYLDYANFVAPLDAVIKLDGKQLGKLIPVGAIGKIKYGVARVKLADGKHVVTSTKKVGVIAYGFDSFVSYGYPAGLDHVDVGGAVTPDAGEQRAGGWCGVLPGLAVVVKDPGDGLFGEPARLGQHVQVRGAAAPHALEPIFTRQGVHPAPLVLAAQATHRLLWGASVGGDVR